MIKKFKYFTILIILFNFSCNPDLEQHDITFIDIKNNLHNFQFVNLSEFADDIEYISLETLDSNLLRSIAHLVVTKDRFIISDFSSCMAFDREGKYICTYGGKGNGPGQYAYSIERISIDEDNGKVYLTIPSQKKFIEFSLEGSFIREISIPSYDVNPLYEVLENDIFLGVQFMPLAKNRLIMFTDKGVITNTYPNYYSDTELQGNIPAYNFLNMNFTRLITIKDKILYKEGLSDTAFYLNKVNLQREPAYYFSFGKYRNAIEYLKSITGNRLDKSIMNHMSVTGFIEIDDFLFFTCNFCLYMPESEVILVDKSRIPEGVTSLSSLNSVRSIFSKKTSELVFLKKSEGFESWYDARGMVNDIDGGLTFWPDFQPYGNMLIKVVDAYRIKNYVVSEEFKNSNPKYPEKKLELEQLANKIDYEDNPVLIITKLKE